MKNMNKITLSIILSLIICPIITFGANPIIGDGTADPHMKVWNNKVYLSVGKDQSPLNKTCLMPYWRIFSSTNLIDWTLESTILPSNTYLGEGSLSCWATDITMRNGVYYFYFSNGGSNSGVLRASSPKGPWEDVLKKPLIGVAGTNTHDYDPSILVDDDGQQYIVTGLDGNLQGKTLNHYKIAKLNSDMISLSEMPRDLITSEPYGFGGITKAQDHNYIHKYNGLYYLACDVRYETSTNIYGPYTNRRLSGTVAGHGSVCEYNGQWYKTFDSEDARYNARTYRVANMTYVHYKDNGDMLYDLNFQTGGKYYSTGVGNYDAAWPQIEAEWFFKISGATKNDSPEGDFEIQNIKANDYLNFPNIKNVPANATINFRISSGNKAKGQIEVRKDSPDGKLLGTCKIQNTGSWTSYKTVPCQLTNSAGNANLYFVFKGVGSELVRLNWFSITNSTARLVENKK